MAASPPRRVRRIAAACGVVAFLAASGAVLSLRNEPAKANYLTATDASRAVTRVAVLGRTDKIVGLTLSRDEANVRVLRSGKVLTWAVRPGREAVQTGEATPTQPLVPVRYGDLDVRGLLGRIHADPVASSCKPTALKAELATSRFPSTMTHVWCLDGAQHSWLGPQGPAIADVDPRTAEGMTAGIADLRRLTGARNVSYLAIRYGGEDAGLDLEGPGTCGDLAACDAVVASRRLHVQSREPALAVREAPARLNYASMIDLDAIDPVRLHATIEHLTQTRKGVDWWRDLTVTLAQRPGHRPTLEFKQGSSVFWTDLDGAETQF